MKNLRNIAASILCASMLFGCQYTGALHGKKHIPAQRQHIPVEEANQINKQEELPPVEQQPVTDAVKTDTGPIKIALLAPLSGSHKELGQGLLEAAQLAVFRIGDEKIILVPIDTKDSTSGAVDAAKKAVAEGAKIILGPVFSSSAKAIARIASDNNIPVVSFSNDKSLAGTGVFAIGFLPEQQINRLVEFAASHGIKEFASVLPNDAYGATVSKELQQIAQNNKDISILKSESYQLDNAGRAISLNERVQSAVDAGLKGKTGPAPVGLLIPTNANVASAMFNYLSQNNFDKSQIQLLGGDQWNNEKLLQNPALEGAMFTASPPERRVDFENKFRSVYGHDAPKLASLAYDGVALTVTIARMSGEGFTKEALTSPRGFVGVDGIFRLREDGLTTRGFAVMAVKNGHAIVIDPAPKNFSDFK